MWVTPQTLWLLRAQWHQSVRASKGHRGNSVMASTLSLTNNVPPKPKMVFVLYRCISPLVTAPAPRYRHRGRQQRPLEYQVLTENVTSRLCSISRIKVAFLIRVDVPFAFGVMTARWSGPSL